MSLRTELTFLKKLSKNNNRDWFEANKAAYLEAKAHFEDFVSDLLGELQKFDDSLHGLNPKKLIFRIYRDVRFSKDKRPYKTNMGASFSSGGKGIGKPGYYLHIEPGNKSFVAGGLYMPDAEVLGKIRQEIDYNAKALQKIMNARKFKAVYGDFWNEDALKTAPKGYPKDHPHIEWLKLKSFIVISDLKDAAVTKPGFLKEVVGLFKTVKPLNDFLREGME